MKIIHYHSLLFIIIHLQIEKSTQFVSLQVMSNVERAAANNQREANAAQQQVEDAESHASTAVASLVERFDIEPYSDFSAK